jgi:hypothetical protein
MDGDPLYALEKFAVAVHTLATGPGDVRSRLHDAFLAFHPVGEADLPADLREDYRLVRERLSRHDARHRREGRLAGTLGRMQNRTGVTLAERIVYIHDRLRERFGR